MKIMIADAKTLKVKDYPFQGQSPLFKQQSNVLKELLDQLDVNDYHDMMKLSFKQSKMIAEYKNNLHTYPAMNLYDGVVVKQLQFQRYHQKEYDYMNRYLYINSPLYGLLRCNDLIAFHRLEMKHRLNNMSLYDYWREAIKDYLKDEDVILSLSTKEYEKMIVHPHMISIDFVEMVGGKMKRTAIYLKQARGHLLNEMILNHIEDIEQIKDMVIDDYKYDETLSNDHLWVFVRYPKAQYKRL